MENIIVYVIVIIAAIALFVKIRSGMKKKGQCCGCNGRCGRHRECKQA